MEKIDVHAHILPEKFSSFKDKFGYSGWINLQHEYDDLNDDDSMMMIKESKLVYDDGTILRKVDKRLYSIDARLIDMKKNGIDKQILSTVPVTFNYWAKSEDNELISRYLNDNLGYFCKKWPNKFIGLGTIPMQNIELAIKETKRCKFELDLKGLIIGTHINERSYDDPVYEPFWKICSDYDIPLFIHPWNVIKPNRWSKYWLPYIVGVTAETTAAALLLAYSGVLERYPRLKLIFSHGGGTLPLINGRANQAHKVYPEDMCPNIRPPNDYLKNNRNICADTLIHDCNGLTLAMNYFGSDSLLFGTDFPFKLGENPPGLLIEKTLSNDNFIKEKLFNKNAIRLFNL